MKAIGIVVVVLGALLLVGALKNGLTVYDLRSTHDLSKLFGGLGFSACVILGGVALMQRSRLEAPGSPKMTETTLPDVATRKATNLARDARLAVIVGLIPLLGLIFVLRLVQWHLLRGQFPALATSDDAVARDFRSARPRFWFAVLFWPVLVAVIVAVALLTN